MIDTVKKYKLIPNLEVQKGEYRLRNCMAIRALTLIKSMPAGTINMDTFEKDFNANVTPEEQKTFKIKLDSWKVVFKDEVRFDDLSRLAWIPELKEYGVYYPQWVRVIFVPKGFNPDRDDLKSHHSTEPGLVSAIEWHVKNQKEEAEKKKVEALPG